MRGFLSIILYSMLVVSCGNREQGTGEEPVPSADVEPVETVALDSDEGTLTLYAVGETMETMKFEPERLEAPPGAKIKLLLINKAEGEGMMHNAVFVEPGREEVVIESALEAGPENEYVPDLYVIAATPLAGPGDSVEVEFTAPEREGSYQYLCTYPGHTSVNGILLIK